MVAARRPTTRAAAQAGGPPPVSGRVEEGREWLASRGGRLAVCYAAGQFNRGPPEAGRR